jgi:ribosomal protein L28
MATRSAQMALWSAALRVPGTPSQHTLSMVGLCDHRRARRRRSPLIHTAGMQQHCRQTNPWMCAAGVRTVGHAGADCRRQVSVALARARLHLPSQHEHLRMKAQRLS